MHVGKKMLWSLAPLIVATALAVAPAIAQAATPHWYSNGGITGEGVKVPYVAWHRLALTTSNGGSPEECSNAVAGYVENPVGGGSGREEIQAWTAYDCTSAECEAAGGKLGIIFENEKVPGQADKLEWPGELTEAVAGTIRLSATNIRQYFHCEFVALDPSEKAGTGPFEGLEERSAVEYNGPGSEICTSASPGSWSPKITNGSADNKPSRIEFSAGAGGELECGSGGKGITTGKLKLMGFEESELLVAKKV